MSSISGAGQRWRCQGAAAVIAAALLVSPGPVSAEFEIPEVDVERGTLETEYRGASHWGLPRPDADGEIDVLRQSHELEIQYGLTNFWAFRLTPNFEKPEGVDLDFAAMGIETQFVLNQRNGDSFGLAFMLGYSPFAGLIDIDAADEFEFGPVVELAGAGWLMTANPRLFRELGEYAEQDSLGFEYAWQFQYGVGKRWAIAALAFGEIDELENPGSFDEQVHLLGPSLYFYSRNSGEVGARRNGDDEEAEGLSWSLGVGTLFGLTEASADATMRVTFAVDY